MTKKLLILALLVGWMGNLFAQTPTDTELWTGATVKLKLNKHLRFDVEEQFRFNDTISSLKKSFTELGIKYKFNKFVALKGNYRHIARPNKNAQNRLSLDLYLGWSKKKFPLSVQYRMRFQNTTQQLSTKQFTYLRNKLSLGYNLSKLVDPSLSFEKYYRFNGKNEMRVNRFTAGLDWRLHKDLELSTFFRVQSDINVKNPTRQNILGFMLAYSIGVKK